jgi:hypothetical protein
LHGHGVANGLVFDLGEGLCTHATLRKVVPRLEEVGRAKETADVVGAKWWARALGHVEDSSGSKF